MDNPLPDYYRTLGVSSNTTASQIREAYKRASLASHPDRFPNATSQERQRYTQKFQTLADAYYVLSDTDRRREYDQIRSSKPSASFFFSGADADDYSEKEQGYSSKFFQSFFPGAFSGHFDDDGAKDNDTASAAGTEDTRRNQPQADGIFAGVFEELLRPEVQRVAPLWKWVGSASGGALGFIIGNIPGALGGAFVGSQLGRIRDAKGKSVAEVFMGLGASQRAEVLTRLFQKRNVQPAERIQTAQQAGGIADLIDDPLDLAFDAKFEEGLAELAGKRKFSLPGKRQAKKGRQNLDGDGEQDNDDDEEEADQHEDLPRPNQEQQKKARTSKDEKEAISIEPIPAEALPESSLMTCIHHMAAEYFDDHQSSEDPTIKIEGILGHKHSMTKAAEPSALIAIAVFVEEYVKAMVDPPLQDLIRAKLVPAEEDGTGDEERAWERLVLEEFQALQQKQADAPTVSGETEGALENVSEQGGTPAALDLTLEEEEMLRKQSRRLELARKRTERFDSITWENEIIPTQGGSTCSCSPSSSSTSSRSRSSEEPALHPVVAAITHQHSHTESPSTTARSEMAWIPRDWHLSRPRPAEDPPTKPVPVKNDSLHSDEEDELVSDAD